MSPLFSKRCYVVVALFAAGFAVIASRFLYLGYYGHRFDGFLKSARQRTRIIPASRGTIIDCQGHALTSQQPIYDVGVDLTQISEKDREKLPLLADILRLPPSDLAVLWKPSQIRWKSLAKEVSEASYEKIKALRIKGVYGNRKFQRHYLHAPSMSYIVGFINTEGQPVCGIENLMQFFLKGQDGWVAYEVNGKGDEMRQYRKHTLNPTDGYTVELTLDDQIQQSVEAILSEARERLRAQSIQALVTHPATGEVLACVTVPFFDSNHYRQYKTEALTNVALSNVYEPGSVFKAVTVAAALDCGAVKTTDTFNCGLSKALYRGKELPLPKDWKTFVQTMDVGEILHHSSNRGTVQIGFKLGAERLYDYGRRFGFGETTRTEFAGETRGIFHPLNRWDGLTITRLPMGHALACSIFQIHYAVGAIANGGFLMYPQFVKRIYNPKGEGVHTFESKIRRKVLKETTARTMRDLLLLDEHSKAFVRGYAVSGKTGTSQKIVDGKYSHSQHVASFSGFFPNKRPQFQITVVVDTPHVQGTGYGSVTAAPIFKEIADNIIACTGLPPQTNILKL